MARRAVESRDAGALIPNAAISAVEESMPRDPTRSYFAGTDRDRAAFEAGIKLGSILHQFLGVPLTARNAAAVERAIEEAARVQPLVADVRVQIDRRRPRATGPYRYGLLTRAGSAVHV